MAFIQSNFAPAGNQSRRGASPQMYVYVTTDNAAAIAAADYFLPVVTFLELGDIIFTVTVDNIAAPTTWANSVFDVTALTKFSTVTVTKKIPA